MGLYIIYGYSYPNPRFCNKAIYNSNKMNYICDKEYKRKDYGRGY